ncbi:MAG: hypothetical protein M3N39_10415 [Pseudomonadota bacterium]|nr:hypothetical protein [Pseudomonadota bacterium]
MQSERDLLAQWAGEELFAAGRMGQDEGPLCRARGEFYMDLMRSAPAQPQASHEQTIIGRLLAHAFEQSPR